MKTYKIWVTLVDGTTIKGTFYDASKDTLVILGKDLKQDLISPNTIEVIKLRREGKVGRGAWIGAVTGTVAGALTGLITDDGEGFGAEYSVLSGGIVGLPIGTAVGIGSSMGRKKFAIKGELSAYLGHLPELQKYIPN